MQTGPHRDHRSPLAAALLVVLAASLFAMLGPASKLVYAAGLTPFAFVTWRAGLGALAIWTWVAWRRRRVGAPIGLRALAGHERRSLLVAVLASALLNLSIFVAFGRTTVALALLCFYTYPALVAVSLAVRRVERLDRARLLALLLALIGMAAVVLGGMDPSGAVRVDPLGVALALGAALCQAVFITVSRDGYRSLPADVSMATVLSGAVVLSAAVAIVTDGVGSLTRALGDPALLAGLVGMGIFAAALPSLLFLSGIRRLGGVRAGILMLFEPVVGVALAAIVLAEPIVPVQVLGGATILIAAAIVQRGSPMPAGRGRAAATGPEPVPGPSVAVVFEPALEPEDGVALHIPGGP